VYFSSNPWRENSDGSVPAHTEGHEGNLPVRTPIRSLRMSGPLDGALNMLAAVHSLYRFVPHSGCSGRL
jgi:hypothetical protein